MSTKTKRTAARVGEIAKQDDEMYNDFFKSDSFQIILNVTGKFDGSGHIGIEMGHLSHNTLYLVSPRRCFFIVLRLDLFVYRGDSLTS